MTFIIFCVIPAVICHSIAEGRNRSKMKAVFVGLLLGWIGLVLLALFLKTRDIESGYLK